MLPTKPWRPSFGPLPAALAGKIPVETQTEREIRRAAIRFYIDETAAIAAETDPDVAKERAARLDAVMNDAVARGQLAQLSPSAGRLMKACDTIFSTAERKSAAEQTSGGDRRPLPEVAYSDVVELRAGQQVAVFGDVAFDSRRRA